jgi:hypothetical protein
MDDDAIPPPAKRPRRTTVISGRVPVRGPDVMVRLLDEDTRNLGLSHPFIMEFHRLDYLTFNSSTVSYLYLICAAIFDIDNEKITLTHSPNVKAVKSLDEDDDDDDDDDTRMAWLVAEDEDQILKGTYCIVFDTDAGRFNVILGLIVLEPNLDLFKVKKKAKKSQSAEETPTPVKRSTMPPPEKTPAQRTPVKQTASPGIPPSPGPSSESIKRLVIDRDGGCIVTDIHPSMCIMSHIIPKSLVEVWSTPS